MTPERWTRIEELFHAARARPPGDRAAFLLAACGDDEPMRRSVESLLDDSASDDGFLAAPPLAIPAHQLSGLVPTTLTGTTLGGYELQDLLGAGGMGEVYRAHDPKLGRDVAIKVLPSAFTSHPDRLARLEREARILAALNHPNICAIYGFEDADGIRLLVLELVEGETLAEILAGDSSTQARGKGLPLNRVFNIARQIAVALEVAHDRGIVHRDLKPANVKITPAGAVKVLDFGLAKAVAGDGSGPDLSNVPLDGRRREGAVIGTAAYMSPEQARGLAVDKRTDIWAFGCVLYEMLTGRVTFAGDTVSDSIAKILERDPEWSALPASTPTAIRRLLLRCLTKDPDKRLRDMGDVRIEIDAIDEVVPGAAAATPLASRRRASKLPWVAAAAVVVAVLVWQASRAPVVQDVPLSNGQFSRFTDWEGVEFGAEISPDGRFVAFKADRDGQLDLWVSQVGTGRFLNLTQNIAPLGPPAILRNFGFSGDGAEIWFAEGEDSAAPKWLIPLTGGTPRPFMGHGPAAPSWSRDDTRLAYFSNGDGDPISIADRTSADARPLVIDQQGFFASGVHNHNPAWSPDGRWLYFAHGLEPTEEMNVWRVRSSGGTPEQLTTLQAAANHLAVLDDRTLLYVARADDRSGPWLWSLHVETKVARRVTSGLEHYTSVSASRDGRRVVTTVSNQTATLWHVPILGQPAGDRDVQPYRVPRGRALSPRFSKDALFYLSGQGAGDGLWRFQEGISSEVWKSAGDSLSEPAAVSPDGTRVAIIVRQDGKLRLSVMAPDGTNARTLAPSIVIQSSGGRGSADWSPDGAWIVVAGTDAAGAGLFKIPVDGQAPVRLVSGQAVNPVWSPDGTLIVYGGPVVGGRAPLLGVRPDGTSFELPDVRTGIGGGHRFLPDGTGLVYLSRTQSRDFWLLDLATNRTRALTRLGNPGVVNAFDITPDGKAIVFDRLRDNSDIVLIDLSR